MRDAGAGVRRLSRTGAPAGCSLCRLRSGLRRRLRMSARSIAESELRPREVARHRLAPLRHRLAAHRVDAVGTSAVNTSPSQ